MEEENMLCRSHLVGLEDDDDDDDEELDGPAVSALGLLSLS
jgi:hypothetical protein